MFNCKPGYTIIFVSLFRNQNSQHLTHAMVLIDKQYQRFVRAGRSDSLTNIIENNFIGKVFAYEAGIFAV